MSTATDYLDYRISPRIKIAALWTSTLFIFISVDLFSLYRADVRADIEAGRVAAFTIGQGYLLGVIVYLAVPSLMLFLSLILPVKLTRVANIVLAAVYALTILGSAIGEWSYFIVGSGIEAALLGAIAYYAWAWPRATQGAAVLPRETAVLTK